jgi:hypothetical protein
MYSHPFVWIVEEVLFNRKGHKAHLRQSTVGETGAKDTKSKFIILFFVNFV